MSRTTNKIFWIITECFDFTQVEYFPIVGTFDNSNFFGRYNINCTTVATTTNYKYFMVYANAKVLTELHGHDGRTVVKWIDDEEGK